MRPFFKGRVVERVPQKPMIITVNTTKAGSASNTFVLPITKTGTELVTIYWGDGQISVGANGNNTHVYAASGVYTIKIYSKIFGGLFFNNVGDKLKILSILSFGRSIHRDLFAAYQGCINLATIDATGFINNSLSLLNAFRDCATVTTIRAFPTDRTTTMSNTFQGCTLLASIPLLALTNCTTIASMFQNCSSLTSIPAFDTSNVEMRV
jgi:surface protein